MNKHSTGQGSWLCPPPCSFLEAGPARVGGPPQACFPPWVTGGSRTEGSVIGDALKPGAQRHSEQPGLLGGQHRHGGADSTSMGWTGNTTCRALPPPTPARKTPRTRLRPKIRTFLPGICFLGLWRQQHIRVEGNSLLGAFQGGQERPMGRKG